jgi:hypothetical protein
MKAWETKGINIPKDYSMMIEEEKIEVQASLDSWYTNCNFSHDLVKETNKSCLDIWDLTLHIIELHEVPHV